MTKTPRLVGGVGSPHASDYHRGALGVPGVTPEHAGYLRIDRGLRGGRLDVVPLDESDLAQLVAEGAGILARLAKDRQAAR